MNLYGGPIDEYYNDKNNRIDSEPGNPLSNGSGLRKHDMDDVLDDEQLLHLKSTYDLPYMTCEQEEALLEDLCRAGVLTKEECSSYVRYGGNVLESLTGQINSNINM